jgi:hypothetical protein
MFPWQTNSKPEKKGRPKAKKSEEASTSKEVPPSRGPTNLFKGTPRSSPKKSSEGVVKERVRQIQTPSRVSMKAEYNLRKGPKPRWVPPAQSFEAEGETKRSLPEPIGAESPNQSLAFRSLALETRSNSSEERFREVSEGGFETGFQLPVSSRKLSTY